MMWGGCQLLYVIIIYYLYLFIIIIIYYYILLFDTICYILVQFMPCLFLTYFDTNFIFECFCFFSVFCNDFPFYSQEM